MKYDYLKRAGEVNRHAIEFGFNLVIKTADITKRELDDAIGDFIKKFPADPNNLSKGYCEPAFKGYQGFPGNACICLDSEIVHGTPNDNLINKAKLLTIDCGVKIPWHKGFLYVDAADTRIINRHTDYKWVSLIARSKLALQAGISVVRPGATVWEITNAIEKSLSQQFYLFKEQEPIKIFKEWCGHSIGINLHEEPKIFNTFERMGPEMIKVLRGQKLYSGDTICIEPVTTLGSTKHHVTKDGWTQKTVGGNFSCHVEHTVLVTEKGHEIIC